MNFPKMETDMDTVPAGLRPSLLALRAGVGIVMLAWSLDKILNPAHAAAVFEKFYLLPGVGETALTAIGLLQLAVILGFLAGAAKTWTYGAILAMHAVSTLSSWRQYLDPFSGANLLFFAAWPMLAACIALFLLRRHDTLLSLDGRPGRGAFPAS